MSCVNGSQLEPTMCTCRFNRAILMMLRTVNYTFGTSASASNSENK